MKIFNIDRKIQIKLFEDLSILNGAQPCDECSVAMARQEIFILQLVALSNQNDIIKDILYQGNVQIYCINNDIVDKWGQRSKKEIELKANELQPLFFVIKADKVMTKSEKIGITFLINDEKQNFEVNLAISDENISNGGCDELWRLSRLDWLNSSRYIDDNIAKPYLQPKQDDNCVKILGRDIVFGENALPSQIVGHFDEGNNLSNENNELLKSPMIFDVGEKLAFKNTNFECHNSYVDIAAVAKSKNLDIEILCKVRYEGLLEYKIKVTAKNDVTLDNVKLVVPFNEKIAKYINGLGQYGGSFAPINFKWNDKKHLDCLFVGDVNLGLRIKWKAENYVKPLINIYYKNMPLVVPTNTWDNSGSGNITLDKNAVLTAESGKYSLKANQSRSFEMEMHITPFSFIDYKKHFAIRYHHDNHVKNEFKSIDEASKNGLNNLIFHHGNMVHPFINYPFIEAEKIKTATKYAKEKGIGVKLYYTVREHSNHMAEVFAYKALGDEIILRKKGEGYSWQGGVAKWLTQYFGEEIIPAWKVEYHSGKYKGDPDVSFIVRPNSRIDNYYIEGLDYMVKNYGIKGIYIDDTALDRTTLERAKKVLDNVDGLIDMHMWNHEEERAGDVSCMNLYTEIFPFVDSLWIGEGYPYKKLSPEYLLTEVSGLPYGKTSQMLQDGGEPFVGMLYAMNNRFGWGARTAPRIYSLWDNFGIQESEMRGYWHSKNPFKSTSKNVYTTCYIKSDCVMICMFNFGDKKEQFSLNVDENLLGFKMGEVKTAKIDGLQKSKNININQLCLGKKKGIIIVGQKI